MSIARSPLDFHQSVHAMDAVQLTREAIVAGETRPGHPLSQSFRPQHPHRAQMIAAVVAQLLAHDEEFKRFGGRALSPDSAAVSDYAFAVEDEPHLADEVFDL